MICHLRDLIRKDICFLMFECRITSKLVFSVKKDTELYSKSKTYHDYVSALLTSCKCIVSINYKCMYVVMYPVNVSINCM